MKSSMDEKKNKQKNNYVTDKIPRRAILSYNKM